MVTTGARAPRDTHPTVPPNVAYWVQFRRAPKYDGTYGFDWVEWTRNSANNSTTDFDDLVAVMGTPIADFVQCYDPGQPGIPAQVYTPGAPIPPAPPTPVGAAAPASTPSGPPLPEPSLAPIVVGLALPPPLRPPASLAIPAKPAILPRYAAVAGLYKQHYQQQLHQGYKKRLVQGNDYYVPWCSMRPHQTIRLKLEVTFLNTNPVQPANHFTVLPDANYLVTINSQPNTGPMNLLPVNGQVLDVTIECLHPAPETRLQVVDELGAPVGELMLAENQYEYQLPVRVVYVLLGKPMNAKDPLGTTPPRPLYAAGRHMQGALQKGFEALDFLTYVNTQTLNQALITCVLKNPAPATTLPPLAGPPPAYQVLLDEDELKSKGVLASGIIQKSTDFTAYCEQLANAEPRIGPFAGLTIFVHELDVPAPKPGAVTTASGTILPVEAKTLDIYHIGLSVGSQRTIAHELGHVLGLEHSFPDTNDKDATEYGKRIDNFQGLLKQEQDKLQKATSPTDIQKSKQLVQNLTNFLAKDNITLDVYKNNPFKFTQSSTENMMDYEPGTTRLSYWKWQWQLMQDDIANYYGTKKLAK